MLLDAGIRVSFVRGGMSVAVGRTSDRNSGKSAKHTVGAHYLLCSRYNLELEIRLHRPHRFLNPDYGVFDCGGVALSEDRLNFGWEATGPILGGPSATRRAAGSTATLVCPRKAGVFSEEDFHRGKSQSPVAWIARRRETESGKPIDKAIFRMVSESPGRTESERRNGPEMEAPEAETSNMGRRQHGSTEASGSDETLWRGYSDDTMTRMREVTGDNCLPCPSVLLAQYTRPLNRPRLPLWYPDSHLNERSQV